MMRFIIIILVAIVILFETAVILFDIDINIHSPKPIKVGLLHSLTGYRSLKETTVQKATLLAIEEINQKGGIEGRKIVPIIKDGQSSWNVTQNELINLFEKENVETIFGCWMPGNRKKVIHLLEKYNGILFYPFQYEGIIETERMVCPGTTAFQQFIPLLNYSFDNFGKKFFLVGSNYIFPKIIHELMKDYITAKNGEVQASIFVPIHNAKYEDIIEQIKEKKPDVLILSILSEDLHVFFDELKKAGMSALDIPMISLGLNEITIEENKNTDFSGCYACWSYFQSINSERNHRFLDKFFKFSNLNAISDIGVSGYISVLLWYHALLEGESTEPEIILRLLDNMRIQAPQGPITMDDEGHYAWKEMRIAQVQPNGQLKVVWESLFPINPKPIQNFRSKEEWKQFYKENYTPNEREDED